MEGKILVAPEQLEQTADSFAGQMTAVRGIADEMLSKISSLTASWEGSASSAYITKFNLLQTDMENIQRMINEHVNDLRAIAEGYHAAEAVNVGAAEALSGNIIE